MSKSKASPTPTSELSVLALQKFRVIVQHAQDHSALIKKRTGISGAQLWLVQEVADAPGSRVREVAQRMSLKSVTVSNLLEPLVAGGIVTREQDSQDRRSFRLHLTPKGKKLLAKAPQPTRGILPDTLRNLDPKSLRDVDLALALLLSGLDEAKAKYASQPLPFTL